MTIFPVTSPSVMALLESLRPSMMPILIVGRSVSCAQADTSGGESEMCLGLHAKTVKSKQNVKIERQIKMPMNSAVAAAGWLKLGTVIPCWRDSFNDSSHLADM